MATEKESAMVRRIVNATMLASAAKPGINFTAIVRTDALEVMISDRSTSVNGWLFYPDHSAYFSRPPFTEERFLEVAEDYLQQILFHSGIDADGVPV